MYTIESYEYDCTRKCRCREHGHKITTALTKRSVTDVNLAAYTAKVCRNFSEVLDYEGRSALHLASSVDRYAIVEWLLNHGAVVNSKDEESGNSALHRALFYGCIDCAVLLLRYGASLDATDNDFRSPLQYICKPDELEYFYEIPLNNEILVWGTNKNYNLGLGNDQGSSTPQTIDSFRKLDISIKSLAISAYHSLFIDVEGNIYSVGHGKGGRLGTDSENSLPVPKRLKIPTRDPEENALCVSASRNHSLVLTNKGSVFACGMNSDQQLGLQSLPEKSVILKEVTAFKQYGVEGLQGIIAKDYHSIAFSQKEIYIWGANKGQFGLKQEVKHVMLPRQLQIPEGKLMKMVESNNSAICCYTQCKQVLLYSNYKMKALKTPSLEPLISMSLTGGNVKNVGKSDSDVLRLLVLTISKCLYIWYEDSMQYVRCVYLQTRQLNADKIILNANRLLILAEGDVYTGKATMQTIHNPIDISQYKDTYSKKEICTTSRMRIDLKRLAQVDRVLDIFADDDFESFAVLQENSRKYFTIPDLVQEENTFKTLLHEVSESDAVHDIVLHVDNEVFPAHKFIVFNRSKGLVKAISDLENKHVYLNYQGLTGKMFEIILKHIYTCYMPVIEDLDEVLQSIDSALQQDRRDAASLFLSFAEKFELRDLVNGIKSLIDGTVHGKPKFPKLRRTTLPNLHDLKIVCAGGKELQTHKCILVARLEYFNLMFSNSWSETKTVNLSTVPLEYMLPLVDFVYTSDVEAFKREKHSENFLYNMIVICDQFFVNRLRKVCEQLILERISTRKCGEMLEFACAYNCELLEKGCLEFICQNLARILEQRTLEACELGALAKLNAYYRHKYRHKLDYRVITPSSEAVSDDDLMTFVADFNVDLESKSGDSENKLKIKNKTKVSKTAISKRNYEIEAIQSMKEISIEEAPQKKVQTPIKLLESELEAEKQLQAEAKSWMKVSDAKKENKNKWLSGALKSNEIMKEDIKAAEAQVISSSQKIKTPEKPQPTNEAIASPTNRFNLNLGDFTPLKGEKLSQKQRKRLSSESKTDSYSVVTTKPIPIPQKAMAWGISQSSPPYEQSSFADIMKSPHSKLSLSPEKRLNVENKAPTNPVQSKQTTPPVESSPGSSSRKDRSFTQILADEKKQKDYYEKLKSKSLILTQIEEAAIAELEKFYNVDNVFDEMIRVERKHRDHTMNFAVWQYT